MRPGSTSAASEIQLAYAHRLKRSVVSPELRVFLQGLFGNPEVDVLQVKDAGGGGDCLFHAIGAALEIMLQHDVRRPNHVLRFLSLDDFGRGCNHLVQTLRRLSAERILGMTNEDFLNFVMTLAQQKRLGMDWHDHWDPVRLLRRHSFGMLAEATAQDVLVAQPGLIGALDLKYRLASHRESFVPVVDGMWCLDGLRSSVIEAFSVCGNAHWGTVTDVAGLADALDIGFIVFSNEPQGGCQWMYGVHTQKKAFPYWIILYCVDNVHFLHAEVYDAERQAYTCFFPDERLPAPLREHWSRCNYAPQFHAGIS